MSAETIMGLVIISLVALVMMTIGICQFGKKDVPVGFYNLTAPPEKEEITDIIAWNKKHGMIWIIYGICIELGFLLGNVMPTGMLQMIVMAGGIILPLPFMIMRHKKLERKYRVS